MYYFHGENKQDSFFEGWYFKHQTNENTIAIIPSFHKTQYQKPYAMLQIITNQRSFSIPYDISKFYASKEKLHIKIGENFFCKFGINLNINTPDIELYGKIYYTQFTKPKYHIMGPFAYLPFLECYHGIISLQHPLSGEVSLNGEKISLQNGVGYIETDWGNSFPKSYTWAQCNFWEERCAIMAAVADIPMMGLSFRGCIASVYYQEKEFRFATYLGAKIVKATANQLVLSQGDYTLCINILEKNAHPLLAPTQGHMNRTIYENARCKAEFQFLKQGKPIFSLTSFQASYEYTP